MSLLVLKLVTSEEIIGVTEESENHMTIKGPVFIKKVNNMISFEKVITDQEKTDSISINKNNILYTYEPKKNYTDNYFRTVKI